MSSAENSGAAGAKRGLDRVVRTLETRTSVYTLHEDGIIVQRLRNNAKQSLVDARENIDAFIQLAEGQKRPCIVDGRVAGTAEPGVREYYATPNSTRLTLALALLVGSAAMRVVANLFLTLNKPSVPTRMFTSEAEALEWLRRIDVLSRLAK
jgi:hypothetical protein